MKNKKGAISSALTDFAGYGAFIIILLVFIFLFNLAKPDKIQGGKIQEIGFPGIDTNEVLLNYLRSNISYSGEDVSMAEYITLVFDKLSSPYDSSAFPEIKSRIGKYFDDVSGCYDLVATSSGKITLEVSGKASNAPFLCRPIDVQTITVPNRKGELIKIQLSAGK